MNLSHVIFTATARKQCCGKVMFPQASVCSQGKCIPKGRTPSCQKADSLQLSDLLSWQTPPLSSQTPLSCQSPRPREGRPIPLVVRPHTGADAGFGQGGPSFRGRKLPVERSCVSEASYLQPGSRAYLRALETFEFLVLKYAFSHILEPLFLSFLISTSRKKT